MSITIEQENYCKEIIQSIKRIDLEIASLTEAKTQLISELFAIAIPPVKGE